MLVAYLPLTWRQMTNGGHVKCIQKNLLLALRSAILVRLSSNIAHRDGNVN